LWQQAFIQGISWKRCTREQEILRFKIDPISFESYSSTNFVSASQHACLPSVDWKQERPRLTKFFQFIGDVSLFAVQAVARFFRPPIEFRQIWIQLAEAGAHSFPLVAASGFALGVVMTLHTRSTLVMFGAEAIIPKVQSLAFFIEIGPLVAGLLVAGRVGAGIGAVLANMRATEQIDAIEALSIDSFKLLVTPRIVACVVALPLLTVFMDFSGLIGGFCSEYVLSHLSLRLYVTRAFTDLQWSNFIPPTLKTAVFGFIIGTVSAFFGYTTNEGAEGVGRAATNSVVVSSLAIILADVILVKLIFLIFPENAI
jgi:phospholipid/cholesterol/gamma-HCH transport system permease protein